jgi:hypothetical protein
MNDGRGKGEERGLVLIISCGRPGYFSLFPPICQAKKKDGGAYQGAFV